MAPKSGLADRQCQNCLVSLHLATVGQAPIDYTDSEALMSMEELEERSAFTT